MAGLLPSSPGQGRGSPPLAPDLWSPCAELYAHIMWETGEGDGAPLQYSCLETLMDGGAW